MHSTNQTTLIITGMHRSGTSFTASLLQSAGLDIGQRLMEPGNGNVKGFFESVDFVEFHETVLRSQQLNDVGWTLQPQVNVQQPHVIKAKEIIAKSARSRMWGWKDPRTTLFLDFWENLLPNAYFLFVYRSPWEVVDSLYRRGDPIFIEQPELAVKIWLHYNQILLNFAAKFPQRCFLISVYNIAQNTKQFIAAINAKFHLNLTTPPADIYDSSLFHTQVSDGHRPTLVAYYYPDVLDTYKELNQKEVIISAPNDSWLEQIKSVPDRAWAFRDWMHIRNLERQVKSLKAELE